MSFGQKELQAQIEIMIGQKGVQIISENGGWREYSGYAEAILEMYRRGVTLIDGNVDIHKVMELYGYFDFQTKSFLSQTTLMKDIRGVPVTFERLLGEIKSVRMEYMPFAFAKILAFLTMEKKINDVLKKELGFPEVTEQLFIKTN